MINNLDLSTFYADELVNSFALRATVAACMPGLSAENIVNLQVSADAESSRHAHTRGVQSVGAVRASYEVTTVDPALSYTMLAGQLSRAVQSGTFITLLKANAELSGAVGLTTATTSSVTTVDLSSAEQDEAVEPLPTSAIIGITVGLFCFFVVVSILLCGTVRTTATVMVMPLSAVKYEYVDKDESSDTVV